VVDYLSSIVYYFFLQITANGNGTYACNCKVYRTHSSCLHINYSSKHWSDHNHTTTLGEDDDPLVIPITGAGQGERSYFYVCDGPLLRRPGAFVRCMQHSTGLKLSCFSSGHQGHGACWHVDEVRSLLSSLGEDERANMQEAADISMDDAPVDDTPNARLASMSHFNFPATEQERASQARLRMDAQFVLQAGLCPPTPASDQCCKCGVQGNYLKHLIGSPTVYLEGGILVSTTQLYAFKSTCGKATCCIHYDGHDDGIFVHSAQTAFAVELFYSYASLFTKGGLSQEAYVAHMVDRYRNVNPASG